MDFRKPQQGTSWKIRARSGVSRLTIAALLLSSAPLTTAYANPAGGQVAGGAASISGEGTSGVTITQSSSRAAINWDSFSIGAGERTVFIQPDASAVIFNRVTGGDPSAILGNLSANGTVILSNPNGIVFGAGSRVDAAGLVATTHDLDTAGFMSGAPLRFFNNGHEAVNASVVNEGLINIRTAGVAAFVAPYVRNGGVITADLGSVSLGAADGFTLDLYGDRLISFAVGDQLGKTLLTADGQPLKALVRNDGTIDAAGGKVLLTAAAARDVVNQAVNVSGTISADSVTQQGGTITLTGSGAANGIVAVDDAHISATGATGGAIHILGDQVSVAGSVIDASGLSGGGNIRIGGGKQGGEGLAAAKTTMIDAGTVIRANADTSGSGGQVVVWSDDDTEYRGAIEAKGSAAGNGGDAEVSGKKYLDFLGTVDLTSAGGRTGTLLLDPEDVTIQTAGTPAVTCTAGVCTPVSDSSILTVAALQAALGSSNVEINSGSTGTQGGDITFANNVTWASGNILVVDAYRSVVINAGVTVSNTYAGVFGASQIPVLLALRADAAGIDNGGGVTNNGTIDFSTSKGAVSIYRDMAGAYTAGAQTVNGSWAAPANKSVSAQFTAYQLINSAADLAAMGGDLTAQYALGKNITAGGVFNGNAPLGAFTGILDGQYCALLGGSACSATGFTMTPAGATTKAGLFVSIGAGGIVRNLGWGMDLTYNYTGTTDSTAGTLTATNNGTIANVTSSGSVTASYNNATTINVYIGDLVGNNAAGVLYNDTASGPVQFTDLETGATASAVGLGGLAGEMSGGTMVNSASSSNINYIFEGATTVGTSVSAGSAVGYDGAAGTGISGSTASGTVSGSYFTGFSGPVTAQFGGFVGRVGFGGVAYNITTSSASGDVTNVFAAGNTGGFAGIVSATGGLINFSSASGDVSMSGSTGNTSAGGFVGFATGTPGFDNDTASNDVLYVYGSSITANNNIGGLIGGFAGGTLTNSSSALGTVTVRDETTGAAANTYNVGGLVGVRSGGTLNNDFSKDTVDFIYKGTTSGTVTAIVGGLIGYISATGTLTNDYAEGAVSADYFSAAYNTGIVNGYIGGLVGQLGNNNAVNMTTAHAIGAVESSLSNASEDVGGLVGFARTSGTLTTTYATGDVSYTGQSTVDGGMGGLVGYANTTGAIASSYATGNVTVNWTSLSSSVNAGGLVGYNRDAITGSHTDLGKVTITANNSGTSSGSYFAGGGLIGQGAGSNSISSSYSHEDVEGIYKGTSSVVNTFHLGGLAGNFVTTAATGISGSSASGYIYAHYFDASNNTKLMETYIGGLVGKLSSAGSIAITGSTATGNVLDTLYKNATDQEVGGLVGYFTAASAIVNSHATGNVEYAGGAGSYVGGLIGQINNAAATVTGSDASGTVKSTLTGNTARVQYVGGIVGYLLAGSVSTSFASGGAVSGVDQTSGSAAATFDLGGQFGGVQAGTGSGNYSSKPVNYTYQGTSSGIAIADVGGAVGVIETTGSIAQSYATGNVSGAYFTGFTGKVSGSIGGFIGENGLGTASALSTSYASGNVSSLLSGAGTTEYLGGFAGWNNSTAPASIADAYAMGQIYYGGTNAGTLAGGLIGMNRTNATVARTFATGYMYGTTGTPGGLMGSASGTGMSDNYWDTETTGIPVSANGTGKTTAQLQAALMTNFSPATWGILAGTSFPYLQWQVTGTPQVVSGAVYQADAVTKRAGSAISGLMNGGAFTSLTGNGDGNVYAGADGYYYYLLAPNTLGASQVLLYLPGATKGDALADNLSASLSGFNISEDTLSIDSSGTALSGMLANLTTAQGAQTGANFIYANSGGITMNSGKSFGLSDSGGVTVDLDRAISATGNVWLYATGNVTQSAAITANTLLALSTNHSFTLTNSGNDVAVLVANTGTINYADSNGFVIGAFGGYSGLGVTNAYLSAGGAVTQTDAISASALSLSGAGVSYTLTNTSNNIATLAGSTGTINLYDGGHNLSIGAANGINGVTAANLYLTDTAAVTETQVLTVGNLLLSGAGGTYTLNNGSNNITALAGNTGTVAVDNGAHNLDINTVNGVNGLTATTSASFTSLAGMTQSQAIITPSLTLAGAGGDFTLADTSNQVDVLQMSGDSLDFYDSAALGIQSIDATGNVLLRTPDALTLLASGTGIAADGSGDTIKIHAASFTNDAGAGALDPGAGRFLVWSTDPAADARGGITYDFKQYNATYGVTSVLGSGNGFLYTIAPTITATLGGTISKTYDRTTAATLDAANYSGISGSIDGDTVVLPTAGTYNTAGAGGGKTVTVILGSASATDGAAAVYGYQFSIAPAALGVIVAKALTVGGSFTAADKGYDGTTAAAVSGNSLTLTGVIGPDAVGLGAVAEFSDAAVGAGKTVSLMNASALTGAQAANYTLDLTGAPTALASILASAPILPPMNGMDPAVQDFLGLLTAENVTRNIENLWTYQEDRSSPMTHVRGSRFAADALNSDLCPQNVDSDSGDGDVTVSISCTDDR